MRYRGYYYDTETGLYYLNSRYYNPTWGRFINADGIIGANKDILSYNLYNYCSNNFPNYVDFNGKILKKIVAILWHMTAAMLTQIGYKFTGEYLEKSLHDTKFHSVTGDSEISNKIKQDSAFITEIQKETKNFTGTLDNHKRVTFAQDDLFGTLHEATIFYKGNLTNGCGSLEIKVYDIYDFDANFNYFNENIEFWKSIVLITGNNLAWLDQTAGIIKPYEIYINFKYDVCG